MVLTQALCSRTISFGLKTCNFGKFQILQKILKTNFSLFVFLVLLQFFVIKIKQEKQREKGKGKSQDCCDTFKPTHHLGILLSAHAQTLEASILQLDQKELIVLPSSSFVASA